MADNFNLNKFIRNNPLLKESIGGYRDIEPMEEMASNNSMKGSLTLDWAGEIPELKAKCKKHGVKCKVITMDGPGGGWPLVMIKGTKGAIKNWLEDDYVNDEEELSSFMDDIEPLKEMDYELEKPENIYADDENETYGRAWGLAGQQLKSAIDALRQDGFDDEDIKNFLMTGIDMYDQAFDGYDDLEENLDGQAVQGYDSEPTKTFKINIDIEALGELDDEFETRNNVKVKKPKGAEELLARYNDMTDIEKYKYSSVPVNFTGTKDALANLLDGDLASQIYGESDAYFRRLNRLFKAPENINELEGSVDIKDVTFISKNGGEAYEEVQVVDEMPGMIKFKVLKAHPNSTRLGKDFTVSTGRFYSNYEQKGFGPKMTDPGYMNRD
jgi:hypothetical protein